MNQFHTPNIKISNPKLYPTEPITKPNGKFLIWNETKEQIEKFQKIKTMKEFENEFFQNPREFDLHGHHFQDLCLRLTNDLSVDQVKSLSHKDHCTKRILRGRVYAISTRTDIDWNGKYIKDENKMAEKGKEINEIINSLILYDWSLPKSDLSFLKQKPRFESTKISVKNMDTQSVVVDMYEKHQNSKICWLNLAASRLLKYLIFR